MWAPKAADGAPSTIELPTGPTLQQMARNNAAAFLAKLDGQGMGVATAALNDTFTRNLWVQSTFVEAFVMKGGIPLICSLAGAASDDTSFYQCFQVFELLCSSGHAVSFCDNGGFRLISRAIAAYRGGATLLRHNALSCAVASASLKPIVHLHWPNSDIVALLVELSMLVHFFTLNLQTSTRTARSNSLIRQDQTWPVSYCEEASSALFVATETEPLIIKSIVDKKLCASLVSAAAAMSEHSCPVAVALLRVCCKCMQSLSVETSRQLHNSATVQGLTAILKSSTMHRDPQLVHTTSIDSLRMYSSMLLISLASELGEAVLQPLLAHGSIKHICAAISQSSFISWALSDRIGSSYALLALCRERRTWLLLAEAFVERAILQLMLDSCHEVRMNAMHMVIAIAQLGPSQMRHMVKHAHSSLCQIFYNCMSGAVAQLQDLEHGSEEFSEMTLVVDALFCLAQQHEAITQQIELRVTVSLMSIIDDTGGEVARRVHLGRRDVKHTRLRRLRHQVAELLSMHALYSKDSDVQLLWLGKGLEACYEMLFDAMSHINIKTRVDEISGNCDIHSEDAAPAAETSRNPSNPVAVVEEPHVYFDEVLNLCSTLNRLFMFGDVQAEMLKAPSKQLQVFLSVLRNRDIPPSASLSIGRILVRLSVLPSFTDVLPNQDGFNRTIVQTLASLRKLGDENLNDIVGTYLLVIGNLTLHINNRKKFLLEGALDAVVDWVGVGPCDSKLAHAASHALQSLMTGSEDEQRLKLHKTKANFLGTLCYAIRDIWKKGLSRDVLAVHCGCVAVLCSGNDISSKAFRETASRHDIIPILHMLHQGLQSETATLLKRPDAKVSLDIQFKLKRNQSTLACVLSATSGFSFNMEEGSGAQLVEAKLCNELVKEVFAPLYPDENVQNASIQILGRMFTSDIVVHALFSDMQSNRVIDVISACCVLITDTSSSTESVIGCCSILEKLTRRDKGVQLLTAELNKDSLLQALLPFTNPFHCLRRLRPHLLTSSGAQLKKLSSVFVVSMDLCKTFSRIVTGLTLSTPSNSLPRSSSILNSWCKQPQQECLRFACHLVSDVLIACCRRDANTQLCPVEHWAPQASDLPSSQDSLVLKLTLAMNVPISLAWVHEFLQFLTVMYDCPGLRTSIVHPIALSLKPAESVEAALHSLSKASSNSVNHLRGDSRAETDVEVIGMKPCSLSEAVFSLCVSVLCCDLTSCEGAKVTCRLVVSAANSLVHQVIHILCDFLHHEEVHRWIIAPMSADVSLCKGDLLLSRLSSMVQVRLMSLRIDRVSIDAFQHSRPGNIRSGAGNLVQTIMRGLAAVADSCVTWMMPSLIIRSGLLNTLILGTEISCAMLLHEEIAESHFQSSTQLLCTGVRGLCGCMYDSTFALQIQSSRIHGALFLLFARIVENCSAAQEKFPPLPIMSIREGRIYFDSKDCLQLDSCLGLAISEVISGETPSRFFFELLLHGATEQDKIDIITELQSDEDNLNSRHRAAARVRRDGTKMSIHCASVILLFINCFWSREHVACCSAGPIILRALSMSQHHPAFSSQIRGAAMKALSLSLKPGNSAILFIITKVLNILPTIFTNGFNFPPPASCIAEPALQALCFLSLDPSCRPQLLTIDIVVALSQWLKVAPKSQDESRKSKDLLAAGQSDESFYAPIFLNFYDPSCALRCRALAAFALVCLFSSSVDTTFADAIIGTPLCNSLLRSAAMAIFPIALDDDTIRLPFECTCKIVQHLSLCCMAMLSSYHSIAIAWSESFEFRGLILRLLSEGQPDEKPYVVMLLFFVSRTRPKFIQMLFEDATKVGSSAIGSVVRSILEFLAEYTQSFRIELADETTPNAAQRDAEKDEFDSEPVSQQNLLDWRRYLSFSRQKGLISSHLCYSVNSDVINDSVFQIKVTSGAFVIPSAGVRRQTLSAPTRNAENAEELSGSQPEFQTFPTTSCRFPGADRTAGLSWVGIEASELLLPRQYAASRRMLRFLNKIFASIPQYRSYIEGNGCLDVFAISLQLPLDVLQKILPTRNTMSLLKHATVLSVPYFFLLPQTLSIVSTALCLSKHLTDSLLNQLEIEKILSIVLVKILETWTYASSKSGTRTQEIHSTDSAAPNELLFRPSITFRIEGVSSLSCVLALECYAQLMQRIGVCCRSFLSCDLQLFSTLLACATSACMPNVGKIESHASEAVQHSNFHPRHAAFVSLRSTSPLEIVAQSFACLRAATKFSPAVEVLLHSPFSNYNFTVDEEMQNRLDRVIRTSREAFYLNPYAVWKSSCSILAQDFNDNMFSPFKLAIRWLKLILLSGSRSHCHFESHRDIRAPPRINQDHLEPEIFNALRTDAASVESITFSCMEIFSLVSLTSKGRDCILADEAATQLVIDICAQNFEQMSLRVFILTTLHNFSLQSTTQSLEFLLRDFVLEFLNDSLGRRNVEVFQISLQIVSNIVQKLGFIGKTSVVMLPIFINFWEVFEKSLCCRVVAATLHPIPAIMRSAMCCILNACSPGNPPKIRRFFASSGIFNILQRILSHPQKHLRLLALGTVASCIDGDTIESLRWSEVSSTIIDAASIFQDKGRDSIDAHVRFMTMACIHNVSVEPLCWENGLDDTKVQAFLSSARQTLTLEAPN